jgi:hypothetical protein
MEPDDIPADVRRFVLAGVHSVPFLETLLLMRAEPAGEWHADVVARRVYVGEREAHRVLEDLVAGGIAAPCPERAGCYLYRPEHADLAATLDRLAAAYATHLVTITNLIHAKGSRKAQQFANAFKWRKDR